MTTILTTPRLRLRRFEQTDVDADHLVALNDNPAVTKYVGEGSIDRAAALDVLRDRIIKQHDAYGVGRWAVERLDDGAFIGWCGFKYEVEHDRYDVGYRFFEACWGKGYGREAAAACMDWATTHLAGKVIVGRAHVDNAASLKILASLGGRFSHTEVDDTDVVNVFAIRGPM